MFRCEQCHQVYGPGTTQMKVVTKKRYLFKDFIDYRGNKKTRIAGWEIEEEKKTCHKCFVLITQKEVKENERKKEKLRSRGTKGENQKAVDGRTEIAEVEREANLRIEN